MRPSIPPTTPCARRLVLLLHSYRLRCYHSTPSFSRPLRHVAFYPRRKINPVEKSLAEEAGYSYSQVHLGQLQYEEGPLNEAQVLHRKVLGARMFILNRPEKLNALTLGMIRNLGPQLKAWDVSKLAKVILIKGVGDGRFCAGDDILDVLLKVRSKDPDSLHHFREKFRLAHMISTLRTPYMAILDGYALGGALGIFAHSPFRIATERTIFSMPETSIGLCPSSGATFFMPKLDGEIGTYLALTGSRLTGVDTFYTGIATHYVPSSRLTALEDRLIDLETSDHEIIHRVIEEFVEPAAQPRHVGFPQDVRQAIDRCFKYDTVQDILAALDREKSTTWVRETRQKLLSNSPTSLHVTLRSLRKGQAMTLCECLRMEFDLMQKFMVTRDFHTGVDAAFLAKPRSKPRWENVTSHTDLDALYFERPSPNALDFPQRSHDMRQYPYRRFNLPSEQDIAEAVTGQGSEFGFENRLKTTQEVLDWFMQGHKGKRGVREKVLDVLERKTKTVEDQLEWEE